MTDLASPVFLGVQVVISSPAMRQLMDTVQRVAQSNATVLIEGESGSGKEIVARAIHHLSPRASRTWVDVSCAALPEHLMESELFGYEKGAFSGADGAKPGLFELADRGTLFLDEIGELPPRMQVKLLRVLDGVPYYRLGGVRKVGVDVRVVAATNQPLEAMVAAGTFRRDLYHRLSQIPVRVPPLRERREDILPIAEHFLRQQNPHLRFSESAKERLCEYAWPGNVRELRNVVARAAVLSSGLEAEVADLQVPTGSDTPASTLLAGAGPAGTLDDMERRMIQNALARSSGHRQRAAEHLGISRRTLSRKLRTYAMEEPVGSWVS
jgi:DNA-binding NtrC family response regulator